MNSIVIYGSSRRQGNSEILADRVVDNLDSTKIYLCEIEIEPVVDQRHTPEGYQLIDDDYEELITSIRKHDILVFSTPLYWYGMSGLMKNFVDRWSQSLRDNRFDFKEEMRKKKAYIVITGSDDPLIKALPLVQQFKYICDFLSIEFAGYIIGKGNKPGEVLNDVQAMARARELNRELSSR